MKKRSKEEKIVREIRKSLIGWYPFSMDASLLYVGQKDDPCNDFCTDIIIPEKLSEVTNKYDYVISVATPEKSENPVELLTGMKSVLNEAGHLLLGMNNRMGIRYLCGDRDPYTNRNFDGIENYRRAYMKPEDEFLGRTFDEAEITDLLIAAGWKKSQIRFWDVLSGLDYPTMLFDPCYKPNEELAARVFPEYNYPKSIFLEEEKLYTDLIKNGLFHKLSNAYLIECRMDGQYSDMLHVTSSVERGREDAIYTIVKEISHNGDPERVEKRAVYPEGKNRISEIDSNQKLLAETGVKVIDTEVIDDGQALFMQYYSYRTGQKILKELATKNQRDKFLAMFDHLWNLILMSSEQVNPDREEYIDYWEKWFLSGGKNRTSKDFRENYADGFMDGPILKNGFFDMVPLNSFYHDGDFIFYDQEFIVNILPAKEIMYRCIESTYFGGPECEQCVPFEEMLERYGLNEHRNTWWLIENDFLRKLRSEDELRDYHKAHRRNAEITNTNRQHMNYSADDYRRLFVDIFNKCDSRKVILFGSGAYSKKFLDIYRHDFSIDRILDNRQDKWGTELDGIPIMSPDSLKGLSPGEYKVIICIKNYVSVMKQLQDMGVYEFSIYDPAENYTRMVHKDEGIQSSASKKKYHVGYIAGVFDLFHIGHLNMFKRAKEQCDYLIVGVVTDEGVRQFKKTEPFIPFEERIEMVRSCRYVDEAIDIPFMMRDTITAWKTLHFDVQFSGSDYVNDPAWLRAKQFLREHGADLVFFPYTQQTSSTKIKALINKELEKNE